MPALPFVPTGRRRAALWLIALIALVAAGLSGSYFTARSVFTSLEVAGAQTRLALYSGTIDNELSRLRHLPPILAESPAIKQVAAGGNPAPANTTLKDIAAQASAEAIYVLDPTGLTIAASNFDQPDGFLGKNYGFRSYFRNALQGQQSTQFAIGATTSRPGYFLAAPIYRNDTIAGVLAIKLDLTALNGVLSETGERIPFTVKKNDRIIFSSYAGTEVKIDDNEYLIMTEEDILGVID